MDHCPLTGNFASAEQAEAPLELAAASLEQFVVRARASALAGCPALPGRRRWSTGPGRYTYCTSVGKKLWNPVNEQRSRQVGVRRLPPLRLRAERAVRGLYIGGLRRTGRRGSGMRGDRC